MAKEADMFHPVDRSREHLLSACNPDGRDSIPVTLERTGLHKGRVRITYQAPTKCTRTSLYEKACLKRSALLVGVVCGDPTVTEVDGSSLFGSAYSSYALKIKIDQRIIR